MKFQNIYTLFREQTAKYGAENVFYTRVGDGWHAQTWNDFEEQVHDFACALLAKGLTKGASVAILAGNVPEWTIADVATIAAGGVGVGIYPTSSTEQCEYIINHSDAEFVFVDSLFQLRKVAECCEKLQKVKEIVVLENSSSGFAAMMCGNPVAFREDFTTVVEAEPQHSSFSSPESHRLSAQRATKSQIEISTYEKFLAFGRTNREAFMPRVEEVGFNAKPEETAIMVYTSGTTGQPKGAML